jgi:predicted CXXCH cytochrome family protein
MIGKRILKFCIWHLVFFLCVLTPLLAFARVEDTKHNLSVSGPGDVRAVSETQICIFCHTPHNASPAQPLWNHELSAVVNYVNYASPTLQSYSSEAEAPPIDGYSKLCLSCHDGTVAIGSIVSRWDEIIMVTVPGVIDASGKLIGGPGYLGTDLSGGHPILGTALSGGHPISIIFDEALWIKRNSAYPPLTRLKWPIIDPDVKLRPTQGGYGVQCTACHDPHGNKATEGWPPFWQKATHDEVCMVCHEAIPPGDIEW